MRILQVCAVDFTAFHLLRPLGMALRAAGHEVAFCCSPGEGLDRLEREGFEVYRIPVSRSWNLARHAVSLARMRRLMKRGRFDLVHTHTPVAGLLGRIAARLARVPLVVYTAHGFYFHEGMRPPVRAVMRAIERFGASLSDLVFVQSAEDLREAAETRIAPADRLVHIGNGVDPDIFDPARSAAAGEAVRGELGLGGGPLVGFTGRIVREKGAVEFARAAGIVARRFPGARFVMVGAPLPSDRDGCLAEIARLRDGEGLGERLVLTGYHRDVPAILSILDVFAMPSWREGMPRSLLEAMAASLPVVATDIRGCREEVVDGETGILVPPRDAQALAGAIIRLLEDPAAARRMGEAGRSRAIGVFDERGVTRLQVERIEALRDARPPRDPGTASRSVS
ncbi:MAG: glycosyltransferase family 4 protein [Candidatus Krumholzibacteria bacterium]|nr:glycosyltransferase family 4 protein [Candidatus Krumholzibacteria bacterium]